MRKEKILKIVVVLIMGIVLFAMSTNVFALADSDSGIDFFEDQSNQLNTNTNTNTSTNFVDTTNELNTNTSTNTNTNTNTNTSTNVNTNANNYNTNLPKAGAPENTMMGIVVTVLAITAIYAYKKVKEYKNI